MTGASAIDALRSADARARVAALEALARADRPLDEPLALAVAACVGIDVKAVQRRAADVLRLASPAARPVVLAALRTALGAPEASRRWGAAYALGRLGVLEPALVPVLIDALASRDGDRRWAAASLLEACAARLPAEVVPALHAALAAAVPMLRKMALYVLRDLELDDARTGAGVLAAARDSDVGVRLAALAALTRLAPATACAAALRLAREDPDVGVRRAAVNALGHLGRGVPEADATIAAALDSSDPGLRRAGAAARRRLRAVD